MTISEESKNEIVNLIYSYGEHPDIEVKQWVMDKILQTVLSPEEYAQFLIDYACGEDGPFTYCWNKGKPPC